MSTKPIWTNLRRVNAQSRLEQQVYKKPDPTAMGELVGRSINTVTK
jgi:hypothetical protein